MPPPPAPLPGPAMVSTSVDQRHDPAVDLPAANRSSAIGNTQKVCVIGSGVSGLAAAWHIQRVSSLSSDQPQFEVTLLEKENWVGGHACTVELAADENSPAINVDLGFMVFNQLTYPNMMALYNLLGIEIEKSCMSLAVSVSLPGKLELEWASDVLFCQPVNIFRPLFWQMLLDMLRFNRAVPRFLQNEENSSVTLREFLRAGRYSQSFVDFYLLPFISAVWSSTYKQALDFPAEILFRFIDNHRLAQVLSRPQWYTVAGRSQQYVQRVLTDFLKHGGKLETRTEVSGIDRHPAGSTVKTTDGSSEQYDHVVIAAHAPQALQMLGKSASSKEKKILGSFQYAANEVVVHSDPSLMPARRNAWMSWNCIRRGQDSAELDVPVCVTYWLNRLQNLETSRGLFVTLNPTIPVKKSCVLHRVVFDHPIFTQASVDAQTRLHEVQGMKGTWFCGAYTRYGFHEDGLVSGLDVASKITGKPVPWAASAQFLKGNERSGAANRSLGLLSPLTRLSESLLYPFQTLARRAVISFVRKSIEVGSLELRDSERSEVTSVGMPEPESKSKAFPVASLTVVNQAFYAKVAAAADVGLAEAYIKGDFEISCPEGLTELFNLFIANRDVGKMKVSNLSLSYFGRHINGLVHRLFRRNSLSGSKKNIEAHYDLSNDMFGTFLGETWMYSCAFWERPEMSLDEAQLAKLDRIINKARIESHHHVLEIGFGWGECAIRIAQRTGCNVTGLTLSHEQLALAQTRAKAAGVAAQVNFVLCDYREATGVFDRIVSIEMMEAIGHEFLGTWFAAVDRLLAPDGIAVTQVITTPEYRYEEYRSSSDFINTYIFPGGCAPSNHALLCAMNKNSNLILEHQENLGPHYATTLQVWRRRFLRNRSTLLKLGFDEEFIRTWTYYFCYCEAGFATRSLGLLQMVFTRPNNVCALGGPPTPTHA